MGKIGIVTDSFSCLDYLSYPYPITLLRASLTIKNRELLDHVEVTPQDFYHYLKKHPTSYPTTKQPSYQSIIDTLETFLEREFDAVFIITLSSQFSQFHANALLAANSFKDSMKVIVFDSKTLGYPQAKMALSAAHMVSLGHDVSSIYKALETMRDHQHFTFAVETISFLKQHGRLGTVKGALGNLLKVKPLMNLNQQGEIEVLDKVRTFHRAVDRLIENYQANVGTRTVEPFIMHANNHAMADYIEARLKAINPTLRKLFITPINPALAAHVGPGAVALGYLDYPKGLF